MGARLSLSGIFLSSLCLMATARASDFELQRLQQKVADQDMLLRRQEADLLDFQRRLMVLEQRALQPDVSASSAGSSGSAARAEMRTLEKRVALLEARLAKLEGKPARARASTTPAPAESAIPRSKTAKPERRPDGSTEGSGPEEDDDSDATPRPTAPDHEGSGSRKPLYLEGLMAQAETGSQPPVETAPAPRVDLEPDELPSLPTAPGAETPPARVDLEPAELPSIPEEKEDTNVLAREWTRNIRLDGFGGGGYVRTGSDGARPSGGFLNYEATINVDAEVWKDVHYFQEIQVVRLGLEDQQFVRAGEIQVDFKDLLHTFFHVKGAGIGLKLGRVDIPFGNDYLSQDVIDNPLITFSVAYPYGHDEGLVLYGKVKGVNWLFSVLDGQLTQAFDDQPDKFVSLKVNGTLADRFDWSASVFRNGKTSRSAWQYGGTFLEPVGARGLTSSAGVSPSSVVDAASYELNARYRLGTAGSIDAQVGQTWINDEVSEFDRHITYVKVEPRWNVSRKWYVAGRFSTIGTFDATKGYSFEGKPFAGGSSSYGFDTKAVYRWALGLGYWPNPRTVLKLETSFDDYHVIDQSPLDDENENRALVGLLAATRF